MMATRPFSLAFFHPVSHPISRPVSRAASRAAAGPVTSDVRVS